MKVLKYIGVALLFLVAIISCKNDDGGANTVELRDRAEEAVAAQDEIELFLETHFYNYEAFENPAEGFDYQIVFDTIAEENADKIPLIEQVESKTVQDRLEEGVEYTLYYLNVRQGGGESPNFPDIVLNSYRGQLINDDNALQLFDESVVPLRFDLTSVVNGYQDAIIEFNGAESFTENQDGSITFNDYGVGAVFIPSGLGYFATTQPGIPSYSQLIFTFRLYTVQEGDQDGDGIPSIIEDLNGNGIEEDDDTDNDGTPNFIDTDDDGDGIPTANEIIIEDDGSITFPDSDNDGTPNYLDSDS
ncbi:FKBP-type peptidyl-prolyl cis-trans isomerase [Luteirhabdus pelagi]|uniref:FKBP-type peptidyl-prolyl cis-trans isomerase n=1 Tax=Luteirhabdus pelagi TaxID=2792783 RepID=UPI001939D218|nr:hypothetical protein [Luteirhabdus pelagi]